MYVYRQNLIPFTPVTPDTYTTDMESTGSWIMPPLLRRIRTNYIYTNYTIIHTHMYTPKGQKRLCKGLKGKEYCCTSNIPRYNTAFPGTIHKQSIWPCIKKTYSKCIKLFHFVLVLWSEESIASGLSSSLISKGIIIYGNYRLFGAVHSVKTGVHDGRV